MRIKINKILNFCCWLVLAVSLNGCMQAPLQLGLQATRQLNRGADGRSVPVRVRLYQLRSAETFQQATFMELWKRDRQILANDLLAQNIITVVPQQNKTVTLPRNANAQYLAALVEFQHPAGDNWRIVHKLSPNYFVVPTAINLMLRNNSVRLVT